MGFESERVAESINMRDMEIEMNDEQLRTLTDVQSFLDGTVAMDFTLASEERWPGFSPTNPRPWGPQRRDKSRPTKPPAGIETPCEIASVGRDSPRQTRAHGARGVGINPDLQNHRPGLKPRASLPVVGHFR